MKCPAGESIVKSQTAKKILAVVTFLIFLFTTGKSWGEKKMIFLKPEGEIYSIAEKDALAEIKEKAAEINWKEVKKEFKKKIMAYLNLTSGLGHACKDRKFSFLPLYTLPFDIKDANGNIIYPAGYTFNPLDYVPFPFTFVFFDGNSEKEVKWLINSPYFNDTSVFLVATGGNIYRLSEKFKRSVFMFTEEMEKRFQVRRTPSVAKAAGNRMVIEEIGIYNCTEITEKTKN